MLGSGVCGGNVILVLHILEGILQSVMQVPAEKFDLVKINNVESSYQTTVCVSGKGSSHAQLTNESPSWLMWLLERSNSLRLSHTNEVSTHLNTNFH